MQDEIKTDTQAQAKDGEGALSETDLDIVAGGLNPQPLPPIVRQHV